MDFTSLKGRLLVATPDMADPNFLGTVVLLLEHGPQGGLGLVLNRPTTTPLRTPLPRWSSLASAPATIFRGGPVEPTAVIGLARAEAMPEDRWSPVLPGLGVVDLRGEPGDGVIQALRVFSGYAGWGAAQVEGELSAGGWLVTDAEPGDAFSASPDALWHLALRRPPHGPSWLAGHRPPAVSN